MNPEDYKRLCEMRRAVAAIVNEYGAMAEGMFQRIQRWKESGRPVESLVEWGQWMAFAQSNGWQLKAIWEQLDKAAKAYEKARQHTDSGDESSPEESGTTDMSWWEEKMK